MTRAPSISAALLLGLVTALPADAQESAAGGNASSVVCTHAPASIASAAEHDGRLACAAAEDALRLLGRCDIQARRPLRIHILPEVRHPFGGTVFGLFDPRTQVVLVSSSASIPALVADTPYARLPQTTFYKSLVVHEVVHAVLHQNYRQQPSTRAAYEYPAYALQIASMPAKERDELLASLLDSRDRHGHLVFSDNILLFDPFFFAARAYEHLSASERGCPNLHALLQGNADFVALSP
jgi:hypothetical protein